jgi:hypothetical protein
MNFANTGAWLGASIITLIGCAGSGNTPTQSPCGAANDSELDAFGATVKGWTSEERLFVASLARSVAMACQVEELRQRPDARGVLEYVIEVNSDGDVKRTSIARSPSVSFSRCIETSARLVGFPAPGRAGSISVALSFRRSRSLDESPKPSPSAAAQPSYRVLGLKVSSFQHQERADPVGFGEVVTRNHASKSNALLISVEIQAPAVELPGAAIDVTVKTSKELLHSQRLELQSFSLDPDRPATLPFLFYPNEWLCEPATFAAVASPGGAESHKEVVVDFSCGE